MFYFLYPPGFLQYHEPAGSLPGRLCLFVYRPKDQCQITYKTVTLIQLVCHSGFTIGDAYAKSIRLLNQMLPDTAHFRPCVETNCWKITGLVAVGTGRSPPVTPL